MTESNERETVCTSCGAMTDGLIALHCAHPTCPVHYARAAAPQAQPSEQQAAKRRISVHGPGTWMSHPEVPQAQPAPAADFEACPCGTLGRWKTPAALASSPELAPAERAWLPGAYRVRVMNDGQQLWSPMPPEPAPISDERIDEVFRKVASDPAHTQNARVFSHSFVRALLAEVLAEAQEQRHG